MPHDFERDLIAAMPMLQRFAGKLAGQGADDLVQDTLLLALRFRARFEPGTSLNAWLVTIMRNRHYTLARRSWRSVALSDDVAMRAMVPASQETTVMLEQMLGGLKSVSYEHRRAFELAVIAEHTMEEAAAIEGVTVGTIKSRITRARRDLIGEETL